MSEEVTEGVQGGTVAVRKRIRRGGKKKFPAKSLTPEGRKRLQRQAMDRQNDRQQRQLMLGRAVAPLNSTQFIIADRGEKTPQLMNSPRRRQVVSLPLLSGGSTDDSDDGNDDDDDEEQFRLGDLDYAFFQKDFTENYASAEKEELEKLSKEQLIERCIDYRNQSDQLMSRIRMAQKACCNLGHMLDVTNPLVPSSSSPTVLSVSTEKERSSLLHKETRQAVDVL